MSEDRVALVTGGSLGIGRATVDMLLAKGFRVAAMARDLGRLEAALAGLDGGRLLALQGDVRAEADVRRVIEAAAAWHGRLDVLVNSAGVSMSARWRLAESRSAEWQRIVDTNLTGTYLMCRDALPHLEKSPDAWILNVQSTAAYRAQPGVSLYAASKYGVRALTEALIEEYRDSNIRVSSVSPGAVDTNIWSHKLEPPSAEQRRRMMRPEDIARILGWLLDQPPHLHIPNITVTPWRQQGTGP